MTDEEIRQAAEALEKAILEDEYKKVILEDEYKKVILEDEYKGKDEMTELIAENAEDCQACVMLTKDGKIIQHGFLPDMMLIGLAAVINAEEKMCKDSKRKHLKSETMEELKWNLAQVTLAKVLSGKGGNLT